MWYARSFGSNGLRSSNGHPRGVKDLKEDQNPTSTLMATTCQMLDECVKENQQTYDDRSQIQAASPRPAKLSTFEKRKELLLNLPKELKTDYRIKQMDKYYNDDLVKTLEFCDSMAGLLKIIQPCVNELRTDHLEVIYEKIGALCEKDKETMSTAEYREFREAVRSSHVFISLMVRTLELIRELDSSCLVKQFRVFSLVGQDPTSKIMATTCQMLKHTVNDLQLEEINDCLKIMSSYSRDSPLANFLNAFYQALLLVASSKILSNKYDHENIEMVIDFFNVLIRSDNFEEFYDATLRLVDALLQEENELDFYQATRLLRKIKQTQFPISFPLDDFDLFEQLITKCNAAVYEALALSPSEEKISTYLDVHQSLDASQFCFSNFYDFKILGILSPLLSSSFAEQDKQPIFHLIQNYAKHNIFNERLLKELYELVASDRYPEEVGEPWDPYTLYSLLTDIRLPFVDKNHLAKQLFNLEDKNVLSSLSDKRKSLDLLVKFVLTDMRDGVLLDYFANKMMFFEEGPSRGSFWPGRFLWSKMNLAQTYLKLFGKTEIETKVEGVLRSITRAKQNKAYGTKRIANRTDLKVASKVSLSTGVSLPAFAIYDQTKGDLLSLANYSGHFSEIDKISLGMHQQLLAFVVKPDLRGTASVYESNTEYQLKKVLKCLGIRPIEIHNDELASPPFLANLALEICSRPTS